MNLTTVQGPFPSSVLTMLSTSLGKPSSWQAGLKVDYESKREGLTVRVELVTLPVFNFPPTRTQLCKVNSMMTAYPSCGGKCRDIVTVWPIISAASLATCEVENVINWTLNCCTVLA